MEEKRKELMALVIGMKEEEHIDSLLDVARYVSSCEDDFHNRDDMVDSSWTTFRSASTRIFRESWRSFITAARNSDKGKKRGRRVCVVPFAYLVFCLASSSSSFIAFAEPSK